MILSLLAGFALGWVGSMPLAGAVSIFVFQRGIAGRIRQGLMLSCGAAVAEAGWCVAALFGADRLLARWPHLASIAESVGGLILIALGIYFVLRRTRLPDADAVSGKAAVAAGSLGREFWLGFTLVGGNISIPINWLALLTVAISLGYDPLSGSPPLFVIGVAVGIVGWFYTLLRLLALFRTRFRPATLDWILKAMGALLVVTGIVALVRAW